MSLLCSPRLDAVYIIKICISTGTGIAILSYGFFHMQDDSYHTFDSDDKLDYYEKSLDELKRGYTKVYRQGYRCPCDPRNEDSSYTSVLKHAERIAIDNNKRPNARAQHKALVMYLKNIPWVPYEGNINEGKAGPLKKHKADKMWLVCCW